MPFEVPIRASTVPKSLYGRTASVPVRRPNSDFLLMPQTLTKTKQHGIPCFSYCFQSLGYWTWVPSVLSNVCISLFFAPKKCAFEAESGAQKAKSSMTGTVSKSFWLPQIYFFFAFYRLVSQDQIVMESGLMSIYYWGELCRCSQRYSTSPVRSCHRRRRDSVEPLDWGEVAQQSRLTSPGSPALTVTAGQKKGVFTILFLFCCCLFHIK